MQSYIDVAQFHDVRRLVLLSGRREEEADQGEKALPAPWRSGDLAVQLVFAKYLRRTFRGMPCYTGIGEWGNGYFIYGETEMTDHVLFTLILSVATLLCSLVSGFLLAFAIVVMPGIRKLNDREFLRAFQVMDGVIQDNQPVFMVVWVGSIVALLVAAVLGIGQLHGYERQFMLGTAFFYVLCVQLPTFAINIPLNNRLQRLQIGEMDEKTLRELRNDFEVRWNRSNMIRTVCAGVVSIQLILLVERI